MMARILVVEDEHLLGKTIAQALTKHGHEARTATTGEEGLALLQMFQPVLVLLDMKLPRMSGMEFLAQSKHLDPDLDIVSITAFGSIEESVQAMKQGAADYVLKPIDLEELKGLVTEILTRRQQRPRPQEKTTADGHGGIELVGASPPMQQVRRLVAMVAQAGEGLNAPTVLITGETGTGKGVIARAIHAQSARAKAPFIEVNCTAIPDSLLEAELFGYEKGTFTDAKSAKVGLFEAALGGGLFLDEIGYLKPELQVKLLKVIEEKRVRRLGSTHERPVDVWILVATNNNLEQAVADGTFREDLYFRLNVMTIALPPLRQRGEDILLLAEHFLQRFAQRYQSPLPRLTVEARAALRRYAWPGNVRELAHMMERAVFFSRTEMIHASALALHRSHTGEQPVHSQSTRQNGPETDFPSDGLVLEEVEKTLIKKALARARGNTSQAARLLGISRNTLRYRLEKYSLHPASSEVDNAATGSEPPG
jgi:two-component system, NtrC family, response regulator AtoC